MPRVENTVVIKAPIETIWELAQDVENLPTIMPDLVSVKVLEKEVVTPATTRVVTEWTGRIKQFNRTMQWTEEDVWNHEEYVCHFWQIRGDFTDYRGEWRFTQTSEGTRGDLIIDYRFEIPLLGALVKKVLQKLMQENCDGMLKALSEEAEKRAGR